MFVIISMVMLMASVLPHHHHQHILCLQPDVEACDCACEDDHTSKDVHHDSCDNHCITNFVSVSPNEVECDVSPDYTSCQLLYSLADILSISLPLQELKAHLSYFYLEKLHSIGTLSIVGLRAPPTSVQG